jgi:hypothetical protein
VESGLPAHKGTYHFLWAWTASLNRWSVFLCQKVTHCVEFLLTEVAAGRPWSNIATLPERDKLGIESKSYPIETKYIHTIWYLKMSSNKKYNFRKRRIRVVFTSLKMWKKEKADIVSFLITLYTRLPDGLSSYQKSQFGYFLRVLEWKMLVFLWPFDIYYGHMLYFMAVWYSLFSFGIYFPFWNVWTKKSGNPGCTYIPSALMIWL